MGKVIHQSGLPIALDATCWHSYCIELNNKQCVFSVDDLEVFTSTTPPHPPLGLVIWIDNQYAAWHPNGKIGYGFLENAPSWMEIKDMTIVP